MSFSKRVLDPEGYGLPPVTVCCGKVPDVKNMTFYCPACGKPAKVRDQ